MKKNILTLFTICVLLLFSIVLTSCKKSNDTVDELLSSLSATSMDKQVPKLTLPTLKGDSISLSDYKGSLVVLNFWASWCRYCQQEAPKMSALGRLVQGSKNIKILGLSRDENKKDAIDFVNQFKTPFPTLIDPKGVIHQATKVLAIKGTPTSFIISPKGKVIGIIEGAHDFDPQKRFDTLQKLVKLL